MPLIASGGSPRGVALILWSQVKEGKAKEVLENVKDFLVFGVVRHVVTQQTSLEFKDVI